MNNSTTNDNHISNVDSSAINNSEPQSCQQHERSGASQSLLTDAPENSMCIAPANVRSLPGRSQDMPAGEAAFNPLNQSKSEKSFADVDPRSMSLSYASNLTATLKIYSNITIAKVQSARSSPYKAGVRQKITRFSASARRNMLAKLAKLRDHTHGEFATLTYGSQFDFSPQDCKRHLSILRKALTRKYPNHGAFWRMEIEERKSGYDQGKLVPHYHLLIYGLTDDQVAGDPEQPGSSVRSFIHQTWTRAVYGQIIPFRLLRTEVKPMRTRKHAMSYASKYAAKEEILIVDENTGEVIETSYQYGRRWGTWGTLQFFEVLTVTCHADDLIEMRRTVAKWLKSRGSGYAKRMQKSSALAGWRVFGMGDQSGGSGELFGSLVLRVITRM